MKKKMLDNAYGLESAQATMAFYDEWAQTYDQEVGDNGYVTPARLAAALAEFSDDKAAPLLDIGCGTGMSGVALKLKGFGQIDGCDFSAEMLEQARAKGIYRHVINTDLENPFPFETGDYQNITACGVLNPGHAPASTLDQVMDLLEPGGLFAFSLNDHALADSTYEAHINDQVDGGFATMLFREYGEHLPKIDLQSIVYVLQKS